jgi:hypothetical protein
VGWGLGGLKWNGGQQVEALGMSGVQCSSNAALDQSRQAGRVLAMHALACQAVLVVVELGGGGLAHACDLCCLELRGDC